MEGKWLLLVAVLMMSLCLTSARSLHKIHPIRGFTGNILSRLLVTKGQNDSTSSFNQTFTLLQEKVMYEGYRNIVRREVILPTGRHVLFDILTQRHLSVVVFVWNTATRTTTLVREYHPGPNKFMLGTVAGMYEVEKHKSVLEAAQHELEEEAQLTTTKWYPLLDNVDVHMPFDKYSTNQFIPFLALDCTPLEHAKPMDDDEYIEVIHNVSLKEVKNLIKHGQINVVSTYAITLALEKLRELGIDVDSDSDNN